MAKGFAPSRRRVQAHPSMKRPSTRWCATPIAACLSLALAGCGTLSEKKSSEAAEGAAEVAGTEGKKKEVPADAGKKDAPVTAVKKDAPAAAGTADAAAKPEQKEDPKKEKATEKEKATKATGAASPDPAAAAEFQGLPKGEAAFILACRELAAGGKTTMTGKDGMVFQTRELAALATNRRTGTPVHAAMVASIKAKADALRASGIELVIAPVPPKAVVYPDFLTADAPFKDRRYDSYLQALYAELEQAGVRVVDVTKALRSGRSAREASTYPRTGVVWSPAAAAATARAVHAASRRTEAVKSLVRDTTIVSRLTALTQNGERFKARSVGWAQGDRMVPATVAGEGAPIVIIGDEHAAAHRVDGVNASLADQVSLAFGTPVETRATPGFGWRQAAAFTPSKDSPTKLVVWCFSASGFLEDPAAAPKKQPVRPRRTTTARPSGGGEPRPAPEPRTGSGAGLQLRDDPGLEARPE